MNHYFSSSISFSSGYGFPRFSGTDPEAWISSIERILFNLQIPPANYVEFAMQLLDGEALTRARPREPLFLERGWGDFVYRLLWEFTEPYKVDGDGFSPTSADKFLQEKENIKDREYSDFLGTGESFEPVPICNPTLSAGKYYDVVAKNELMDVASDILQNKQPNGASNKGKPFVSTAFTTMSVEDTRVFHNVESILVADEGEFAECSLDNDVSLSPDLNQVDLSDFVLAAPLESLRIGEVVLECEVNDVVLHDSAMILST